MMNAKFSVLCLSLSAGWGFSGIGCTQHASGAWEPTVQSPSGTGAPSAGTGGQPGIDPTAPPADLFGGKTVQAAHSAPVVGGTLLVTRDGRTIVAADVDRDAVFLVDSVSHVVRKVLLQRGDEPGRVAEGPNGSVFVALRRAGAVLAIDVSSGAVVQRASACGSPRGLGYDSKTASLYVACRSGQLLTLDAQTLSLERTLQLDTDLRDVIVRERDLVVTRFMSAEVMVVAEDGSVSRRASPPSTSCGDATVAYRALALPDGQVALAHQISSAEPIAQDPGAYGGTADCPGGLVARQLSAVDTDTPSEAHSNPVKEGAPASLDPHGDVVRLPMTFHSFRLPGAGPLDVAFDAQGTRVAVIAFDDELAGDVPPREPGFFDPAATLWLASWGATGPRFESDETITSVKLSGEPTAVAFSADGRYLVQSREPAALWFEDGTSVPLSDESHADSGHRMFHMNSGLGIACASCHPEGGDDGHVWRLPEGLRRTMPLEGGVMERAPFHWDGALGDMGQLLEEVMSRRMGLQRTFVKAQISALSGFLEQLPRLPPADGLDAAAVQRGQALFQRADVACASCHSGSQYTNNQLVDVGTGGKFVTPTLLGVGLRPALFHDGCAKSIEQRFGVCGGTAHGKPELLSADEQADLITFLRSL